MDDELTELLAALQANDIEIFRTTRGGNRLWPPGSLRRLSRPQRDVWRRRRHELNARAEQAEQAEQAGPPPCVYCGRPCVGPDDRWYRILHWRDPAEVERRMVERRERDAFDRLTWPLHF